MESKYYEQISLAGDHDESGLLKDSFAEPRTRYSIIRECPEPQTISSAAKRKINEGGLIEFDEHNKKYFSGWGKKESNWNNLEADLLEEERGQSEIYDGLSINGIGGLEDDRMESSLIKLDEQPAGPETEPQDDMVTVRQATLMDLTEKDEEDLKDDETVFYSVVESKFSRMSEVRQSLISKRLAVE